MNMFASMQLFVCKVCMCSTGLYIPVYANSTGMYIRTCMIAHCVCSTVEWFATISTDIKTILTILIVHNC